MPDNKDKINDLHGNLIKDGYELPDINTFKKDMSNPASLTKLRETLVKDGYDMPDINTFKRDMGFGVDFKTPKEEPMPEKPKSTSIFGEMPGPTKTVSESTKGQNLKQQELIRVQVEEKQYEVYKKNKEERLKKVKSEALKNTTKKALEADKINFVEGDSNWTSKQKEIEEHISDGALSLTKDNQGNDVYKRSLGLWESLIQSGKRSFNDEKLSAIFSTGDINEKIKAADELIANPEEEEGVPIGIPGSIGSFGGEVLEDVVKGIGGAALGAKVGTTIEPGYGTAIGGIAGAFLSMAPSAMTKKFRNEVINRYKERLDKISASGGKITDKIKIDAMNDAVEQGHIAAGAEAAKVLSLSLIPGGKAVAAEKGFVKAATHAIKHTAYDGVKQATVAATGGAITDISAASKGYNVAAADAFSNIFNNASEGFKTALAFGVAHQSIAAVKAFPKYVKSAAFDYMSNVEKSSLMSYGMAQEKNGIIPQGSTEKMLSELDKYKQAKDRIPSNLDGENASSFAGHIQKKMNLENIKKQTDVSFHPEIDKQIEQVNLKIQELIKSPNPINEEVDHLTGDTGEATRYTEKEKAAVEQNLEPIETVEQLRAEEQKEYEAIDPKDEVKRKEIYDKYDKLITPLLEKQKTVAKEPKTKVEVEADNVEKIKAEQEAKPSYTEEQKIKDEEDAKYHGFDNQHEALNSVEKRTGVKYDKYEDIPKDVLKTISEERSPDISIRNEHTGALDDIIKNTEYENNARSAGLREQPAERPTGEIPSETIGKIGKERPITDYSPEQQQHIRETESKLGEQSKKLFDAEGKHEYGESYEEFLLRKGC